MVSSVQAVMPWSLAQRRRMVIVKDILDTYFSGKVQWIDPIDPRGDTKVEITMTTNSDQTYRLRVYLPADFPNSVPDMIVCGSPAPMPDWGGNGEIHTLKPRDGYLRF